MTSTFAPPFDPSASYHEAGHAFAYWYLGVDIHSVQVLPNTRNAINLTLTLKDGTRKTGIVGVCEPKIDLLAPRRLSGEDYFQNMKAACVKQIFVSAAGPINSERDGGLPLNVELRSGQGDAEKIDNCCNAGRISILHRAKIIKLSYNILSTNRARRAMRLIAARLQEQGYLRGRQIASCCDSMFGNRPRPFDTSR